MRIYYDAHVSGRSSWGCFKKTLHNHSNQILELGHANSGNIDVKRVYTNITRGVTSTICTPAENLLRNRTGFIH